MNLELKLTFASGDDLINFLGSLTAVGRKLCGLSEKTATAMAREVNTPKPDPGAPAPAHVTAEMQSAARASVGKDKPTASAAAAETMPPTEAVKAPTYEKSGLADLILAAQVKDSEATRQVLVSHGGVANGTPNGKALKPESFEDVRAMLQAIIDTPAAAEASAIDGAPAATADDTPVETYETSGIKELITGLQARAKEDADFKMKLVGTIRNHGGVDPATDATKGSAIPPAKFAAARAALQALKEA